MLTADTSCEVLTADTSCEVLTADTSCEVLTADTSCEVLMPGAHPVMHGEAAPCRQLPHHRVDV